MKREVTVAVLLSAISAGWSAAVLAQAEKAVPLNSANQSGSAAPKKNRLLEEVVVTAQKREERLQDVPIAIQAFSREKMEALGIQTV